MENNIKTLERIIEQYQQGNINEEGFKNMVELVGSLTGESTSADYVKTRSCATRMQEIIEEGGIFSIYGNIGVHKHTPAMRVHMTFEGMLDMMIGAKENLLQSYTWQIDDYCEYSFYDQERDITYFVLLDEDDVDMFEIIFGIELSYTHDREGRQID